MYGMGSDFVAIGKILSQLWTKCLEHVKGVMSCAEFPGVVLET